MNLAAHIGEQVKAVNRSPSDGQKRAGNYRKGHVRVHGLDISIENPRGSYRHGVGDNGKPWRSRLPHHYGYFRGTEGSDGDHVDVFLGPHLRSGAVYIIDQKDLRTGDHDEHKVMLGFGSEKQAREAYVRAFSDGKGAQRISSVEGMTIERLKDWLKGRSVRRADGGRVGYADGGAPAFDQTTALPAFDQTQPADPGILSAAGHGLVQGATMNFGDELAGARATAPSWVPEMVGPVPAKTLTGVVRAGMAHVTGDKDVISQYEKGRDEFRATDKAGKDAHPYIHGAGEFAGAIAPMAMAPEVGAARALPNAAGWMAKRGAGMVDAATQGGIYGGVSGAGEGEDIGSRAMKAAQGIVGGIVGGAVASPVGEAVGAGLNWAAKKAMPVVQFWRDKKDPIGAAAATLRTAINADQEMIANGTAKGLTIQQWAAARRNGEPVTLADLGAGNVQSLLRSAANTSPEARAMLEEAFEQRFLRQNTRTADTIRNTIPGGQANAHKTADQLVAEYDAGRVPAYKLAYQQGDRPLLHDSEAINRLMGTDTFTGAMKRAISSGKDRDAAQGLGGFNPMATVTEDGRVVFNKGANGVPTYPNLQYWDQVKRELDSVANISKRSGDNERADLAGRMATILRNELDARVPSYASARGVAEKYFGESNALEAGRKLAGKKADPVEIEKIMRQMKPDERDLFKEGYISGLATHVEGIPDTTNIVKGRGIFQSPNERRVAAAIFGPGGMAQMEARMHLERVMSGAREALGNSSTARQLIEAGLAGGLMGSYDLYKTGGDYWEGLKGFGEGAAAGHFLLRPAMAAAAKKITGTVNEDKVREIARMLVSDNPRDLQRGLKMVAQNKQLQDNLRRFSMGAGRSVNLAAQAQPSRLYVGRSLQSLQGPVPGRAEDEQKRP